MSVLFLTQDIDKKVNAIEEYINNDDYTYIDYKNKCIDVMYLNDKVINRYSNLITNENKSIIGFMLGEVYGIEEKKVYLQKNGCTFTTNTDIEVLIKLYEYEGIEALKGLNGKFIITIIDKRLDKVLIINDRYGYYNYYYYEKEGKYTFCNEAKILLSSIKELKINASSVNDFFNFGYMIDDKTMIQGVKKVNPASIITLSDSGIMVHRYWEWNNIKKNCNDSYEVAIDKVGKLFIQSVERIISKHDRFNIPLSGGLDSRAIVAAIDYLGMKNKIHLTYTFGKCNCDDYIIAKKVAEVASVPHKLIEITPQYWWNNVKSNVLNSMGAINIIHTHGIASKEVGLDKVFLNGFIGDLVLGGSFLKPEIINMSDDKFSTYLKTNMRSAEGIKHTEVLNNFIETDGLYNGTKNYNSKDYFYLESSRVKNFTLIGTSVLGNRFNDAFPFVDNDLINYIYSLPDEWRMNSRLYKDMLLKFFPKYFLEIPWQKTGVAISASPKNIKIRKLRFFVGVKFRVLLNRILKTNLNLDNSNFVDYNNWIKIDYIKKDIYKMLLNNDFIDDKYTEDILKSHMSSKEYLSRDIGLLCTYSIFKDICKKIAIEK